MKSVGSVLSHFLDRIASDEDIALIFLSELWPQIVEWIWLPRAALWLFGIKDCS